MKHGGRQIPVRLSAQESARLEAIAAHYGLNLSSTIRMLLKREADALGLPEPEETSHD